MFFREVFSGFLSQPPFSLGTLVLLSVTVQKKGSFPLKNIPFLQREFFLPNHQQWCAEWKFSCRKYTLHTRFCTFWRRFECSVGACRQKFLRRMSVRGLLRVRCWLGKDVKLYCINSFFSFLKKKAACFFQVE